MEGHDGEGKGRKGYLPTNENPGYGLANVVIAVVQWRADDHWYAWSNRRNVNGKVDNRRNELHDWSAVHLAPLSQVAHFGTAPPNQIYVRSPTTNVSALIWARAARHDGISGARATSQTQSISEP